MEAFLVFLGLPLALCTLALLLNLYREHRRLSVHLKPNCLLTRYPVVFITGPRSLFYFRKYWNFYPEILAEHGYPVFTLHLPWRGKGRTQRFYKFILNSPGTEKYHFICDAFTAEELKKVFDQFSRPPSVTIIKSTPLRVSSPDALHDFQRVLINPSRFSSLLSWSYQLHLWSCDSRNLPSSEDLGLNTPTSTAWLLEKMQEKAEQDFLLKK